MLQNISAAKPYQKVSLKRTKSTKSGMSGKSRVTVKTVECGTGKIRNWFAGFVGNHIDFKLLFTLKIWIFTQEHRHPQQGGIHSRASDREVKILTWLKDSIKIFKIQSKILNWINSKPFFLVKDALVCNF